MIEILLATYNGDRFLHAQLESLFNQTFDKFIITVRDDGSTDNTLKIINKYITIYPDKIRLLHDSSLHIGSTLSFACLIEHSSHDYLMLCDQDDVWLPNKIEITLKALLELEKSIPGKPLMVFTDLKVVDEQLTIINSSFINKQKLFPESVTSPTKILALNMVAGCTIMVNKISKGFILPILSSNIYHDQWIAVNIAYYGAIKYLPVSTILYRQHNSNTAGAPKIGVNYFVKKFLSPKNQIKIYINFISNLNFRVNVFLFIYYKFYYTLRRLF